MDQFIHLHIFAHYINTPIDHRKVKRFIELQDVSLIYVDMALCSGFECIYADPGNKIEIGVIPEDSYHTLLHFPSRSYLVLEDIKTIYRRHNSKRAAGDRPVGWAAILDPQR